MKKLNIALCLILFLLSAVFAFSQEKGFIKIRDKRTNEVISVKIYDKSYAVCIGIDEYQYWPKLNCAVADALGMKAKLLAQGFDDVKVIKNEEATKKKIEETLSWLSNVTTSNDRVVIYFSGHGHTVEGRTKTIGYIIPVDCPKSDYYANAISMTKLKEISESIKAKHVLYIMDSCYSGVGLVTRGDDEDFLIDMTKDPCVYMITAGKAGELAIETEGHGIFTRYVLRGMDGEADYDKNGVVSSTELGLYCSKWVSHDAKELNTKQTPQFGRLDGEGEIVFVPNMTKEPSKPPEEIIGKDGAPMVLIPAGEFQMGSNDGQDDEKPVHTVYLDAFYIDKYEVTNAQYRKFVKATGHKEPEGYGYVNGNWQNGFKPWQDKNFNGDDQPVVCVSWEDAKAYADWIGKRLPTEAEWEKAARGGVTGKKYVWGDEFPPSKNAGNFADISAKKVFTNWSIIDGYDDGYTYTAPVGSFKPNGYGLYDIAGNVWEWCADWYDNNYYATSPKSNPAGSASGSYRVLRGGSWLPSLNDYYLRVSSPTFDVPSNLNYLIGFRCAGLR